MYFRNKFDEEFLYMAENIYPKGGSVRLSTPYPSYFIFERPAFDEEDRYVVVKPVLLYNKIVTNNPNDEVVEDYIVLCKNRKDTVITCLYDPNYQSEQDEDYICNFNYVVANGDMVNFEEGDESLYFLTEHPDATAYSPEYIDEYKNEYEDEIVEEETETDEED